MLAGELVDRGFLIGPICPIYGLRPIFATDSESSAHTLSPFGGVVFACAKE